MAKNIDESELSLQIEHQKINYLTQLYQLVATDPDSTAVNQIFVISGKMQALNEFGEMLKNFINHKIN